ncbi:MAG: radical SAM protein, partial [Candidatus Omnitrophica bacterium]|nr:radical SAM protein [Candidatus Omnitrophota bacterium]
IVILGGILPTTVPEFALKKTNADIAVKGEAELTIVKLLNSLASNPADLSRVPGIVYRDEDGQFIDTGPAEIEEDLNKILRPAYELFPMNRFVEQHFYPHDQGQRLADIVTSRGCPFNCNFCYCVSKPRYRKIGEVIEELIYLKKEYNINGVNFLDENFVLNKNRIQEFLDGVKTHNLDLKFTATARASVIDKEIVKMLYQAGCRAINIGLESGDQQMLDRMHKKTTVEQITQAIETARRGGLFVEYPCMVGNIGETEQSMRKTFALLKKLAWGDFQCRIPFFCTPFPGTEIYDYALEHSLISGIDDFYEKFTSFNDLSVNLSAMPNQDFITLFNELAEDLRKYYAEQLPSWKPSYKLKEY